MLQRFKFKILLVFSYYGLLAQISVLSANLQDLQIQIKNLQREGYFISLERKRKLGVRQKLKDEMTEEKKRERLKKTIEEKIKKEVSLIHRAVCILI